MLLAYALAASAPSLADPLGDYAAAVRGATSAVNAALPRLAACARPKGQKLVLRADLRTGEVGSALVGSAGTAKVQAPCFEKAVRDVFARERPAVGREAAVVLDLATLGLEGDVAIFGELSADQVEAGVRGRMDRIAQCYVAMLPTNPELRGEVVVSFTVLPDGTATGVEVKRSTLGNVTAEACVVEQVGGAVFSPPQWGAIVRVSYPFTFQPT